MDNAAATPPPDPPAPADELDAREALLKRRRTLEMAAVLSLAVLPDLVNALWPPVPELEVEYPFEYSTGYLIVRFRLCQSCCT